MNQQAILKHQFDAIQKMDTTLAKKKHYTKSYYYKNKERYKKYYQDNKEAIKEYAKNYKCQKEKKIAKKQGMTIRHGTFVVDFHCSPTQNKSSTSGLHTQSFLQFFQRPPVQPLASQLEAYEQEVALPQQEVLLPLA